MQIKLQLHSTLQTFSHCSNPTIFNPLAFIIDFDSWDLWRKNHQATAYRLHISFIPSSLIPLALQNWGERFAFSS